jgi:hypothetical protein
MRTRLHLTRRWRRNRNPEHVRTAVTTAMHIKPRHNVVVVVVVVAMAAAAGGCARV